MKYAFIHQHSGIFRITSMCKAMGVSRGGYYDWFLREKQGSPRQQRQALLGQRVKAAFEHVRNVLVRLYVNRLPIMTHYRRPKMTQLQWNINLLRSASGSQLMPMVG